MDDDFPEYHRIKKSKDLPDWFDTKKYESAVHLDAKGWEEQLEIRSFCHEQIWQQSLNDDIDLAATTDYLGFRLHELLAAIRETPIYPFYTSTFHDGYSDKFRKLPHRPKRSIAPGIAALTPEDIINLVHQLPVEKQRELIEILSSTKERSSWPYSHRLNWLSEPIEDRQSQKIKVNTYLPGTLLLQSFEQYLTVQEAGLPADFKGKSHRSNLFREWCNCGLLQYIDLEIWSVETHTRITRNVLANAIFPGKWEKGADNIRTTTEKHSDSILHDRVVMHTLRAYAQQEEDSASG